METDMQTTMTSWGYVGSAREINSFTASAICKKFQIPRCKKIQAIKFGKSGYRMNRVWAGLGFGDWE